MARAQDQLLTGETLRNNASTHCVFLSSLSSLSNVGRTSVHLGSFLTIINENIHVSTLKNIFLIFKNFTSEEMDLEMVICQMSNSWSGLPDFQFFILNHLAVLQNKSMFK